MILVKIKKKKILEFVCNFLGFLEKFFIGFIEFNLLVIYGMFLRNIINRIFFV